jgi:hypothetical protein
MADGVAPKAPLFEVFCRPFCYPYVIKLCVLMGLRLTLFGRDGLLLLKSETKKGLEHHTKYRIPVYTGQGARIIKC